MTLTKFNKQYKYKSDKLKFGYFEVWSIPEMENDGYFYGDCEDYCIFLKNNIVQFEHWNYYYCTLNGNGHCILVKDDLVIDCNTQCVVSLSAYKLMYNIDKLKKYNIFTIISKFIFGSLYKAIRGTQ